VSTRKGRASSEADPADACKALCPTELALLDVVGWLPLVPTTCLLPFTSSQSRTALYASVGRLIARGLVKGFAAPSEGPGGRRRLALITETGLQTLAAQRGVCGGQLVLERGLTPGSIRALIRSLPSALAQYRLLEALAGKTPGSVRLVAWRRGFLPPGREASRSRQGESLMAYAALAWGGSASEYLLIADSGGLSPMAARRQLVNAIRMRQTGGLGLATVAVATTSPARREAWRTLLHTLPLVTPCVRRSIPGRPGALDVRPQAPRMAGDRAFENHSARVQSIKLSSAQKPARFTCRVLARSPGSCATGTSRWANALCSTCWGVIRTVGPAVLGSVIGANCSWVRRQCAGLVRRNLAHPVAAAELPGRQRARRDLCELTHAGLRKLSAYLGLPLAAAVRLHGLAGGGEASPIGARASLLHRLDHTLGADAVFTHIAQAARDTEDGELIEWRNAAACARGSVRPDGYGVARLGRSEQGFFVEFDRGTVRSRALRGKFTAYQRYSESLRAQRDYAGFPPVLVVTTGPGAEIRIAEAAASATVGHPGALRVFVTTVSWLLNDPAGAFGPIWRTPQSHSRQRWWGSAAKQRRPGPSHARVVGSGAGP
jgi:Replication-relaxation